MAYPVYLTVKSEYLECHQHFWIARENSVRIRTASLSEIWSAIQMWDDLSKLKVHRSAVGCSLQWEGVH